MGELAVEDERRFGNVSVSAQIVDVGSGRHLRWWVLPVVVVVVVVVVVTQLLVVLVVGIFRHRGGWVGDFRTLFVEQRHLVRFFCCSHTWKILGCVRWLEIPEPDVKDFTN